nr:MAG TPA: hypothetical protein [Bacteriophage sp.]
MKTLVNESFSHFDYHTLVAYVFRLVVEHFFICKKTSLLIVLFTLNKVNLEFPAVKEIYNTLFLMYGAF